MMTDEERFELYIAWKGVRPMVRAQSKQAD